MPIKDLPFTASEQASSEENKTPMNFSKHSNFEALKHDIDICVLSLFAVFFRRPKTNFCGENRDEAMAASSCYSADLHRMKMEQFCFYFHLDLSSAFFFFQTAGAVR